MNLLLIPNPTLENAFLSIKKVISVLHEAGANVCMIEPQEKFEFNGIHFCSEEMAWNTCDMVVTLGGDGTILHVASMAIHHQKPVLGINFGRLGYLTALEKDELYRLNNIISGQYIVEKRSVLAYEIQGSQEKGVALNDITFFKSTPERTMSVDIFCENVKVSSFHGDGVVFSTPTGSTAYSMSAGGPIVDARLEGIIVTQICAHLVKMPSMVFSGDRVLHVVSNSSYDQDVLFTCDGKISRILPRGVKALVYQSKKTMPLVQFQEANQLQAIDSKLKSR